MVVMLTVHAGGADGEENKAEEEEEDTYKCPKPIPPGPPSLCPKLDPTSSILSASPSLHPPRLSPSPSTTPLSGSDVSTPTGSVETPTTQHPFIEGEDGHTEAPPKVGVAPPSGLVPAGDWSLGGMSSPVIGGTRLGQVSAVAVDGEGHVHVLHRGPRVWDSR